MSSCFFTVARGSEKYLKFAINLARSFNCHHVNTSTKFYIVSDKYFKLPGDLKNILLKVLPCEVFGNGLEFKLNFDIIAPEEQSIFIDSDCLIYRNIEYLFHKFHNSYVSVIGFPVQHGVWCDLDIRKTCEEFRFESLPRFNGGLYYVKKSNVATEIYSYARELYRKKIITSNHRHAVNEEPIMSIAIQQFGQTLILDDGSILGDLASSMVTPSINVLNKISQLNNPIKSNIRHKFWLAEGDFSPAIIHFSSSNLFLMPYFAENKRLLLHLFYKHPVFLSNLIIQLFVVYPYSVFKLLKNIYLWNSKK